MWDEFPETKFVLHHTHNKFKVKHGDNVEARVYEKEKAEPEVLDPNKFSSA